MIAHNIRCRHELIAFYKLNIGNHSHFLCITLCSFEKKCVVYSAKFHSHSFVGYNAQKVKTKLKIYMSTPYFVIESFI